jgi:hypothetical protein
MGKVEKNDVKVKTISLIIIHLQVCNSISRDSRETGDLLLNFVHTSRTDLERKHPAS